MTFAQRAAALTDRIRIFERAAIRHSEAGETVLASECAELADWDRDELTELQIAQLGARIFGVAEHTPIEGE